MSTINILLANELVRGNGKSKFGSAGYCLVRYQNRTKYDIPNIDLYNPDTELNVFDYAIFSNREKYEAFLESDTVGGVDVLWASEKFKKDEIERISIEEKKELLEDVADILNEYGFEDDMSRKPSARERQS